MQLDLLSLGKFELHPTSTCLLELLAAEYLHETNISIFDISLMFICSLDALKKSSKKKKTSVKKEVVGLLNKLVTVEKGQESK